MRTAAPLLLYAALAALGTYQTFRPTFDSGFVILQTERGDGMLNHYILENSWLVLTQPDYRGTLITPPFCFPQRGTIYYSENLFGSAPVYWALRAVLPLDLAYMWWQIALCALNLVAFALVCRWWGLPHLLAACGGFLWAYALVHADQIKHQQMIGRFWMPFAAYYAWALVTDPTPKALNRLLGSVFLQCLTCFYSGWFLAVGMLVFVPALGVFFRGAPARLRLFVTERPGAVIGICVLWGAAMAALFVPYKVYNPSDGYDYSGCFGYLPAPAAWLTGPDGSKWSKALAGVSRPEHYECKLFCGFGVYALTFAALATIAFVGRARSELRGVVAACLVTAVAWWLLTISTAPDGESLWRVLRFLPGGGAVRVVSRVYVVVYLFGTLAALGWLHLVTEPIRDRRVRVLIHAAVLAVLVWEQTGIDQLRYNREDFHPIVDEVAAQMRGAEVGYLVPRYRDRSGGVLGGPYGQVFAMWVGMRANVPMLNGYSGVVPEPLGADMTDDQIREWLKGKFRGKVRVIDPLEPRHDHDIVIE